MSLHLLAADSLRIERAALAAEFQQTTGRALRRTGVLPALALLACLRCTRRETWTAAREPLPTTLFWHTRSVIAEEATPLLRMMLQDREALMPYDFLASQPALMGVSLHPHWPELGQAVCLPWVDAAGTDIWPRALLLAVHALGDPACQRVLCVQLDRDADGLQAHALSLSLGAPGPQALATLQLEMTPPAAGTDAATTAARDFVPRLSRWLRAPSPSGLHLGGRAMAVQASLKLRV